MSAFCECVCARSAINGTLDDVNSSSSSSFVVEVLVGSIDRGSDEEHHSVTNDIPCK